MRPLDQASLVIAEPERLLPRQRSARGESKLVRQVIALLDAGALGEEVVLVQRVIAVELPHAAAHLAGARFQRGVEHRAAGTPVLGAERAGQDFDLVHRVDRRLHDIGDAAEEVDVAGVVVDAVEEVVVLRRPDAVGGKHQRRARPGLRRHDPCRQTGKDGVIAPVDRQILDRVRLQRLADGAGTGLEQRRVGGDQHRLAERAGLEREVDQRLLLDADRDASAPRFLEAGEIDFDRVSAGADRCKDVGAVLAGHRGEH